jgi:hypothetical protein
MYILPNKMTDIDAMQTLIQEKLAELSILQDKLETAVEEEENAKRTQEETEKWYAEENEKAIREAEQKPLLDEEKKVQDAIEKRRLDAEAMETITIEEAHNDLFTNKETPFVFRKYMRDFANAIVRPSNLAYMDECQWLQDYKYPECGRMVREIMGCEHLTGREHFNPKGYLGGDIEWTYKYIMVTLGACCHPNSFSENTGPIGYCWEGTFLIGWHCYTDPKQGKYWKSPQPFEEPTPLSSNVRGPCGLAVQTTDPIGNPIDFEGVSLWKNMTYQY